MATASPPGQSTRIAEHLQCAICFELINDSRLLPTCQHTFCLACLKHLVQHSQRQSHLQCPSCRQDTILPDGGPNKLPPNRLVNQLIEELQSTKQSSLLCEDCDEEHDASGYCEQCELLLCDGCVRAHAHSKSRRHHTILAITAYQAQKQSGLLPVREQDCPSHRGEQLEAFCITCQKAICYKCAAIDHKRCETGNLEVACSEKKANINQLITQLHDNLIDPLQSAIKKSEQHESLIVISAEKANNEIVKHFDICQQLLQQRKQKLLNKIHLQHDTWKSYLQQARRQLTADLHSAVQVSEASKQTLTSTKKHSQLISAAPNTIEQLTTIHQSLDTLKKTPLHAPQEINFSADLQDLRLSISKLGDIKPDQVSVMRTPSVALKNTHSTFLLKWGLPTAPVVRVEPPEGLTAADVAVQKHDKAEESYLIKLKTKALGKHKVHIQVSGCEKSTESFDVRSVPVPDKPKKTIGTEGDRDYQFNNPSGISVCEENHILVADSANHRIQEFDCDLQLVRSFRGNGTLMAATLHPSGVVLATDNRKGQLQVFSRNGRALYRIGSKGISAGQFLRPRGIGVTNGGHVVVADAGNNRIQIIDIAGTPIQQFSSCGGDRKLHFPRFLTVDPNDDQIFVANHHAGSVEEFTKNGQHVRSLGQGHGSKIGQMKSPSGVALAPSGHLLVAENGNARVSIFSREGECVGLFGSTRNCADVACTESGHVFVSEEFNNCIQVYKL